MGLLWREIDDATRREPAWRVYTTLVEYGPMTIWHLVEYGRLMGLPHKGSGAHIGLGELLQCGQVEEVAVVYHGGITHRVWAPTSTTSTRDEIAPMRPWRERYARWMEHVCRCWERGVDAVTGELLRDLLRCET